MQCPKCGSTEKQWSHGTNKKGKARWYCQSCKSVYTFEPPKYSEEFKKNAIKLYLEGNSGRAVGRILKVGPNTCLDWVKKYSKDLPKTSENDVETAEMDELYTHIKKD